MTGAVSHHSVTNSRSKPDRVPFETAPTAPAGAGPRVDKIKHAKLLRQSLAASLVPGGGRIGKGLRAALPAGGHPETPVGWTSRCPSSSTSALPSPDAPCSVRRAVFAVAVRGVEWHRSDTTDTPEARSRADTGGPFACPPPDPVPCARKNSPCPAAAASDVE